MLKKSSKKYKVAKKTQRSLKLLLFFLLIPTLLLTVVVLQQRQTLKQQAQTVGCGAPGDKGNELGVGKYCTKNGGQCLGTGAPFCSADFKENEPGLCSRPCLKDADCGNGASCHQDALGKGCKPNACNAPPTATLAPTKVIQPTVTLAPTITTRPPTANPTYSVIGALTPTTGKIQTPTIPQNATVLFFKVYLHGIGDSGDSTNPTANNLSNKNPKTIQRPFTITIHNTANQPVLTKSEMFEYRTSSGLYAGMIDLGTSWASGNYNVTIATKSFLGKSLQGVQIAKESQINIPQTTLIAGDTNGDNKIDLLDYNIIIGCYSETLPPQSCNDTQKPITDLNDDNQIDKTDYILFLREINALNKT